MATQRPQVPSGAASLEYYRALLEEAKAERLRRNELEDAKRARVDALADAERERAHALVDAERARANALEDVRVAHEHALIVDVQNAYLGVAAKVAELALERAKHLLAAAGAIATVYSGIVGLVFADGERLPWIGILPPLLLGISVTFSSAFGGHLSASRMRGHPIPAGRDPVPKHRLHRFITWTAYHSIKRAWMLRVSIYALGLGVASLPLPFVALAHAQMSWVFGGSIIFLALLALNAWSSDRAIRTEIDDAS